MLLTTAIFRSPRITSNPLKVQRNFLPRFHLPLRARPVFEVAPRDVPGSLASPAFGCPDIRIFRSSEFLAPVLSICYLYTLLQLPTQPLHTSAGWISVQVLPPFFHKFPYVLKAFVACQRRALVRPRKRTLVVFVSLVVPSSWMSSWILYYLVVSPIPDRLRIARIEVGKKSSPVEVHCRFWYLFPVFFPLNYHTWAPVCFPK